MNTADIGANVTKALDSIVSNDYLRKLLPSMDEMNENMARMVAQGKHWQIVNIDGIKDNPLNTRLHNIVDSGKLMAGAFDEKTEKKLNKIIDNMNLSNLNESFEKIYQFTSSDPEVTKDFKKVQQQANDMVKNAASNMQSTLGNVNYTINMPKAYFSNPDKDIRKARVGAAVGAYAGVAIGGRVLSGGSLTTDSYGRKDIAGIPFI